MAVTYKAAFKSFKANVKKGGTVIAQDVAYQLAEKVVLLTPVDTTRAEANWNAALNTFLFDYNENARNSGGNRPNLNKAKAVAVKLKLGDEFVIANATPYVKYLEEGSSQQAPNGMVAVTAALFGRMVEKAASRRKS